jgi:hypothetical protein
LFLCSIDILRYTGYLKAAYTLSGTIYDRY